MHRKLVWVLITLLAVTLGLGTVSAQDDNVAAPQLEQPDVNAIPLPDGPNAPTTVWSCGTSLYAHSSSTPNTNIVEYAVVAGNTYYFRVYGREYSSDIDPLITLYAPDGVTVLDMNDDYDGLDSLLHYTFTSSGTYKLKIEDNFGGSRGGYYIYFDMPVYVSMATGGTVDGVAYSAGDILRYRRCANDWEMFLDVSNLGITGNTAGFAIERDNYTNGGRFLMSFAAKTAVPGVGQVPPHDIVELFTSDVGADTAGSFYRFFDGSDVGLSKPTETLDGIMIGESGNVLVSLTGKGAVPGVNGIADEDLLRFRAQQWGGTTRGAWDTYFDGSDVGLAGVDIGGVWKQGNTDDFYLSFDKAIAGGGANAALGDIVACRVSVFGPTTACSAWYNPPHAYAFDASAAGLTGVVDAVDLGGALAEINTVP